MFMCVERERVRNGSRERKHKSLTHRNGRQEEKAYFFISLRVILQSAFLLLESYSWWSDDECSVAVYFFGLGEDWTAVCVQQSADDTRFCAEEEAEVEKIE